MDDQMTIGRLAPPMTRASCPTKWWILIVSEDGLVCVHGTGRTTKLLTSQQVNAWYALLTQSE